MGLASVLVLGLVPQLVAARALEARQSVTCDFETAASSGDTCSSFASEWGLTLAKFESLNPIVTCPGNLVAGTSYCVIGTVSAATSTSRTSSSLISTTTSTSSSLISTTTSTSSSLISTTSSTSSSLKSTTSTTHSTTTSLTVTSSAAPSPTQSGLASNCNNFHLVVSGDTCAGIESEYGISATEVNTWNPFIDSSCDNLWLGYYICVGVPGATRTTSATAPTSTGPSPQMPSIVSDCDKYYRVESGDGCYSIEQAERITSAEFLAWNPYIDSNCDNLWLGYYVCVGI